MRGELELLEKIRQKKKSLKESHETRKTFQVINKYIVFDFRSHFLQKLISGEEERELKIENALQETHIQLQTIEDKKIRTLCLPKK